MQLRIDTPAGHEIVREVDAVTLTGALGELTILPGHTPLMTTLQVGPMTLMAGGTAERYALNRGFVEVLDDAITVLTETCECGSDVDQERAKRARERAEERLGRSGMDSSIDVARAEYALKRALTRLSVAGSNAH